MNAFYRKHLQKYKKPELLFIEKCLNGMLSIIIRRLLFHIQLQNKILLSWLEIEKMFLNSLFKIFPFTKADKWNLKGKTWPVTASL